MATEAEKEMAYTLMNELNNRRDWTFDGKSVTAAEVNEMEDSCVILLGLEDDTDVAITVETVK